MLKPKTRPEVKNIALPAPVLRGTAAETLVATCGASAEVRRAANQGTQRGLIKRVVAAGLRSGKVVECFNMSFDLAGDSLVVIEDDDSKDVLQRIDGGMQVAVGRFAQVLEAKGLVPEFFFVFHDEVYKDPQKLAQVRAELNLSPCEMPAWLDGYEARPIASMTTAKDPGLGWSWTKAMRRRGGRT